MEQLQKFRISETEYEVDRAKAVLNIYRNQLVKRQEYQERTLLLHQIQQEDDYNRHLEITLPEPFFPTLFYPDGKPMKTLFIHNIYLKFNRERLTQFLNGHVIEGFTLSKIRLPPKETMTARIHCEDLAISCQIRILSCLKQLTWSLTGDQGEQRTGSAIVVVECGQDLMVKLEKNLSFQDTEFYKEVFRQHILAKLILKFLEPADLSSLFIATNRHYSIVKSLNNVGLDTSWLPFTGSQGLRNLKIIIEEIKPCRIHYTYSHEIDMVKKVLEYIVKVYSQKGKTQTNLLVLNLKNIRVNHKLITFVCKNINVKRLELSLSKGDIGKYLKSQYLQQLYVSNTNFFSFLYVKSDNLSNLQQIFLDNCIFKSKDKSIFSGTIRIY